MKVMVNYYNCIAPTVEQVKQMSYMQLSQKFYDAFKQCGTSLKSPSLLANFMPNSYSLAWDASLFLLNNLLHMYSNCAMLDDAFRVFCQTSHANTFTWNTMLHALVHSGQMQEAKNLFDEMPVRMRDSVSWTTMISGYCQNGFSAHSIKTFKSKL